MPNLISKKKRKNKEVNNRERGTETKIRKSGVNNVDLKPLETTKNICYKEGQVKIAKYMKLIETEYHNALITYTIGCTRKETSFDTVELNDGQGIVILIT